MIRNIVVGRLRDGVELSAVEPALAAIAALDIEGTLTCQVGTDVGVKEGSWDFAITNDFVDADAYRAYDLDVEHNRIRAEMIAPITEQIVRAQFEI